jgi:hypothetical protein
MADHLAELSSVATALDELTGRITRIADALRDDKREELASPLYEVERALDGARRRLAKLVDRR